MPLAAGVAGVVNALRKLIDTTDTSLEPVHFILALLCGFINKEHINFCALEAQGVFVCIAITKEYSAAVGKNQMLLRVVVLPQSILRADHQHLTQR